LIVAGTLRVDGVISAAGNWNWNGAGGSGGSVNLRAGTLSGNGAITAPGGSASNANAAGGGGGRVAVRVATNLFAGSVTACGGALDNSSLPGKGGSVFFQIGSTLRVDTGGCGDRDARFELSGSNPLQWVDFDVEVVRGALVVDTEQTVRSLVVRTNGSVTHTAGNTNGLRLQVSGDLTVEAGGAITADAKGYPANQGPGAGGGGVGGSYGGAGGNGGWRVYGSATEPVELGSGGGGGGGQPGWGSGGGSLQLIVAGTLRVDGVISAAGNWNWEGGGGSGGSVNLRVGTLSGSGAITAPGGSASNVNAAGGGGGRVAVRVVTNLFTGSAAALGAKFADPNRSGGDGTVYVQQGYIMARLRLFSPVPRNGLCLRALPTLVFAATWPLSTNNLGATNFTVAGPAGSLCATNLVHVGGLYYAVTFPPLAVDGAYHFRVLPTLLNSDGNPLDQNGNGIPGEPDDAFSFDLVLDTAPPHITQQSPAGDIAGTVTFLDFWFSERMDPATFVPSTVALTNPAASAVAVSGIQEVGLSRYRISFPSQTLTGQYRIVINSNATDLAGNGLAATPVPLTFNLVPVDLQLTNLTVKTNELWCNDLATISWSGRNNSGAALLGSWQDAVYLSQDDRWDINDLLLGTVSHDGGLSAGGIYAVTNTFFIPGALPGSYYLLARADIKRQEHENGADTNNTVALGPLALGVPGLSINAGPENSTLTSAQRGRYYAVTLPPGQSLRLTLNGLAASGQNELYASLGAMPTRTVADFRATASGQTQQVVLPSPPGGGTYYILVYGNDLSSGSMPFTLTAEGAAFFVENLTPGVQGNAASAILTLTGVSLDETTRVEFVGTNGIAYHPASTLFLNSATLRLYLDLTNWLAGTYDLRAFKGTNTAFSPGAFRVLQGGMPRLAAWLESPKAFGFNIPIRQSLWITYSNCGTVPMPAPILTLHGLYARGECFVRLTTDPTILPQYGKEYFPGTSDTVTTFGLGTSSTPWILQPGESGRVPIYYLGIWGTCHSLYEGIEHTLNSHSAADVRYLDWVNLQNLTLGMQLNYDQDRVLRANYAAILGSTWGSYAQKMGEDLGYLCGLGHNISAFSDVWRFQQLKASGALCPVKTLAHATDAAAPGSGFPLLFQRVYQQAVISRLRFGRLGRGWSHNWEISALQVLNSRRGGEHMAVVRNPASGDRWFTRLGEGVFAPSAGDYGSLVHTNGAFRLLEQDQTEWQFRPDGQLDYVQDNNANRVTLSYADGRLSALTHSSGKQFLLDYNAHGRLWHVTDPVGAGTDDDLVTTYEYDSTGEHLLNVRQPGNRVTQFAYDTGHGLALEHALISITNADNRSDSFTYDSIGRLASISRSATAGVVSQVAISYGQNGEAKLQDGTGRQTTVCFGAYGEVAQVRDGENRVLSLNLGTNLLLEAMTLPGGARYQYTYGSRGLPIAIQDPLQQVISLVAHPTLNRLTRITDARTNSLNYSLDSRGNGTSVAFEDGSHEDFGYDVQGNVVTRTNRRGGVIEYRYNATGQLTHKHYSSSLGPVDFYYTYDAAGILRTAVGPEGTNSMTYDPNTGWLTHIEYPGGKTFLFDHDAMGNRTRRTDQDGYAVAYLYDAAGRLKRMTNSSGQLLVDYDYDAAGRVSRKTLGNGIFTTYTNNGAGQVLALVNHKPDGSLLSAYEYTYDEAGRRTSMRDTRSYDPATLNAQSTSTLQTYGYDALGQLANVTYSSGRVVSYSYDAAGNRTAVVDSGVSTPYQANALNEYTSVGATTCLYDADGNLTNKTENAVTTSYTYNAENRLIGVSAPTDTWTYDYDSFGNRISTTHSGQAIHYVVDPAGLGNITAEYDATDNLSARYEHGYGLLARLDSSDTPAYYSFSAIGHTSEMTDPAGEPLNAYAYDPFANPLSKNETVQNPFQFVGEFGVMNEKVCFVNMRARSYDPKTGRFVSPDPIGLTSGDANLYRYARNSPIVGCDPSGLDTADDIDTTVSGLCGLGTGLSLAAVAEGLITKVNPFIAITCPMAIGGIKLGKLVPIPDFANPAPLGPMPAFFPDGGIPGKPWWWRPGGPDPWGPGGPFDPWGPGGPLGPGTPDGPGNGGGASGETFGSYDPNDKIGPAGYGVGAFVQFGNVLSYEIHFENKSDATAPAREIVVTDPLDPNLDLDTLEIVEISFGTNTLSIPLGLKQYEDLVPIGAGASSVFVDVRAGLDYQTRTLTLRLSALDPLTGWYPEDPLVGLLYPEDGTGRGQGHITYLVRPRAGTTTGTVITNQASIVFDYNDPIATPLVFNTIDAGAPQSSVAALPGESGRTFLVQWAGQDNAGGTGVASYDVYVSTNAVNFLRWLAYTTNRSAWFVGEPGRSYSFYAIARDWVGNEQSAPGNAQGQTTVPTNAPVLAVVTNRAVMPGSLLSITNTLVSGTSLGAWRFMLGQGTPTGATINETNGVFSWMPSCSQASRSYPITVWVTDTGNTNLLDATSFAVVVSECVVPSLGRLVLQAGDSGKVPIHLISSVPLTNLAMTVAAAAGRLTNLWVESILTQQICTASLTPSVSNTVPDSDLFDLSLLTCSNQFLIGTQQVAWLHFSTVSNLPSAFVSLNLDDITGYQSDGTAVRNFAPQSGRLVIIGEEPLLECLLGTNGFPSLVLYGKTGWNCEVQSRPSLQAAPWQFRLQQTMTDLFQSFDLAPGTNRTQFFRALRN
jgi:RHS repeat-associated protein/uncharacterized repeat protein (TIGR01451 family)